MDKALALAVLVYAGGGAAGGGAPPVQSGSGPRERIVRALDGTVIEHAVDAALADRRAGWRTLSELAFLSRGKAALDAGRRAREAVELDESERQLALAEAAYAEGLPQAGIAQLCADAALEHGVTLGELGRTDEARAAFVRALGFAPHAQLTERLARPDVVRLFRDVAKAPPGSARPIAAADPTEATLESLRAGPSQRAAETLVATLGLDAVVLVASSSDGQRLVGARVQPGCSTESRALPDDAAIRALLDAPCDRTLALALDDARLAALPVAVLTPAVVVHDRPRRKVWPIVVGTVLGVAAATVIAVTIGFVVSDPRYTVHVDPHGF